LLERGADITIKDNDKDKNNDNVIKRCRNMGGISTKRIMGVFQKYFDRVIEKPDMLPPEKKGTVLYWGIVGEYIDPDPKKTDLTKIITTEKEKNLLYAALGARGWDPEDISKYEISFNSESKATISSSSSVPLPAASPATIVSASSLSTLVANTEKKTPVS